MAFVGNYDAKKGKVTLRRAGNHIEVDKYGPVVVDSREPVFIWTQHHEADTKYTYSDKAGKINGVLDKYRLVESASVYASRFPSLESELNSASQGREICSIYALNVKDRVVEIKCSNHPQSVTFAMTF